MMDEKEHIRNLHRSLTDMVAYTRHEAAQGDGIHEAFSQRFLRAVALTEGEPYPGHDAALAELKAAIRAFTVDVADEDGNKVPNGSMHEARHLALRESIDDLAEWLDDGGYGWTQEAIDEAETAYSEALADAVKRLCKAAAACFGEDFQAPAP